jgi:hypothetical protein
MDKKPPTRIARERQLRPPQHESGDAECEGEIRRWAQAHCVSHSGQSALSQEGIEDEVPADQDNGPHTDHQVEEQANAL